MLRFFLFDQLRFLFIPIKVIKFIIKLVQIEIIIVLSLDVLHQYIGSIRNKLGFQPLLIDPSIR
jgi:hypothetical protein